MKVSLNENNTLISVVYNVSLREQNLTQIAEITPTITIDSSQTHILKKVPGKDIKIQ